VEALKRVARTVMQSRRFHGCGAVHTLTATSKKVRYAPLTRLNTAPKHGVDNSRAHIASH